MRALRVIIAAFVALSLAVLPASAAEMRASMSAGMADASHAACCPQSDDCVKQTKKDCGHSGACALKCSVLSATTVGDLEIAPPLATPARLATLIEALRAPLDYPPLPPPRA